MTTVTSYPSVNLEGINDKSQRLIPFERETLSQHTPLFATLAQMGRPGVNVINSARFVGLYGSKTLEPTSDYYTHQSEAVAACIAAGNSTIAVNRIIPRGARTASISLGVDSLIPNEWFMSDIETAKTSDTYIPIMEAMMDNEGDWGNEYGFTLQKGTDTERRLAGIDDNIDIYKFKLVKIDPYSGSASVVPNLNGDYSTLVTFKPDTNGRADINYFINDRIRQCFYRSDDDVTQAPTLKSVRFYIENFATLAKASPNYDPNREVWNQDMNTIFGNSMVLLDLFRGTHHLQFSGGTDGLDQDIQSYITRRLAHVKIYDDGVRQFLESLTENNFYTDPAKYPYSAIWDTGFSYDTKLAMRTVMETRRDVAVILSCFTVADYSTDEEGDTIFSYVPVQNEQQIQAMGAKLQSAFRLFPESYRYGTAALRCTIVKNSGVINNSPYKKRRSVVIDLIKKVSMYMGSGTGNWKQEYAMDNESNRLIEGWSALDVAYQKPTVKLLNSENGLTFVDTFDTRRYYYPFYQTIYNDNTSVLKDFVTMMACCYLEKVGMEAWRRYGGDTSMGQNKTLEKITRFLIDSTKDSFHNRFTIVPRVNYTDETTGFSGTDVVLEIYANKTKISNTYTIEANRMSDLYNPTR